jgi:hypothetical protein
LDEFVAQLGAQIFNWLHNMKTDEKPEKRAGERPASTLEQQ